MQKFLHLQFIQASLVLKCVQVYGAPCVLLLIMKNAVAVGGSVVPIVLMVQSMFGMINYPILTMTIVKVA